jgi:exosortase/archaeosortase family protein
MDAYKTRYMAPGISNRKILLDLARFVGLASAIALALYYLPNYFFYERVVGENAAYVMQLISMKGTVLVIGDRVFLNQFEIQRMCTGVQVICVFFGIVVAIPKVSLKKRILAFGIVAVCVHLANIGRIAFEIWLLYDGVLPWSLAHYPTGLILGIVSVAFLILAADYFIPEIGDMTLSVLDCLRRG